MSFTRQRTNKELLKIRWQYPKSLEFENKGERTRAVARMIALTRDEALAKVAEGDARPLLIMRECGLCKGTDDALLSRKLGNEKTLLLTRWFRCVKLRPNVLEKNHTYHNLFGGKNPPHLFLCMADGSNMIPLDGQQGQSSLWKDMVRVLGKAYAKDPNKAVKAIFRLMARYDYLYSRENGLREQIEAEIEARGPRSPKVKRLRAKLAKLEKQREKTKAEQDKASNLELRTD